MNGFQKHNLHHTSPSQLNMWADAPCAWVAKYLYGRSAPMGVAVHIGQIVEAAVAEVLTGSNEADAVTRAETSFKKITALNPSEKDRERVVDIAPMVSLAVQELKQYGEPDFANQLTRQQHSVELLCRGDDWTLPVKGFLDFVFPKHGLIIDLKTTLRCPSEISTAHARQAAIYASDKAKGNMECKMLYVTPKKTVLYGVDDVAEVIKDVKTILVRQEAFLRLHDKETIRKIVPVDCDSFYWNNGASIRKDLYNI